VKQRSILAVLAAAAVSVVAGCASPGPQDYSYRDVRALDNVTYGTVESARPVHLNEANAPAGTIAGAAIGGLLGNTIGHGDGRGIATILGAVGGGLAGNAIERDATAQNGEEIVVHLDGGATVAVVQGASPWFQHGERVRVLSSPSGSRVEAL
jgi:outer membrane lipoprotein SlyB